MESSPGQTEQQEQSQQNPQSVPPQREPQDNAQQNQPAQQSPQQYTLYVGDLAKEVSEEELYTEFSQFGQINLKIVKDRETKESKGYAFVNFLNLAIAQKAQQQLNYKPLKGKCIRVMFNQKDSAARQQSQNNIFVKNLDKSVNSRLLFDYFSQFGSILSCKVVTEDNGESKGFGFVHFQKEEEALKAIESCNGQELASKVIFVGPFIKNTQRQSSSENYNNLYVNNLPDDISQEELKILFLQYGQILSMEMKKDKLNRTFAFICFERFEDALKAKENLHNSDFKGKLMNVVKFENKNERMKKLSKEYAERKRQIAESTKGCNLYVKNIDHQIKEEQLQSIFSRYGEVVSCKIMTEKQYVINQSQLGEEQKSKGFGFVCFKNPKEAEQAKTELSKININDKHLYINYAEPKEQRQNRMQELVQKYGTIGFGGGSNHNNQSQMHYLQQYIQNQWYWNMYQQQMFMQNPMPWFRQHQQYWPHQQHHQMRRAPYNNQNSQMHPQQMNRNTLGQKAVLQNQMRQGQVRRQQMQYRNHEMVQQQQQEQQLINPQELQGKSQQEQQQLVGEKLYKLIFESHPQMAGKITGMLLEMDVEILLQLLRNPKLLNDKIKEAVAVLEDYEKGSKQ